MTPQPKFANANRDRQPFSTAGSELKEPQVERNSTIGTCSSSREWAACSTASTSASSRRRCCISTRRSTSPFSRHRSSSPPSWAAACFPRSWRGSRGLAGAQDDDDRERPHVRGQRRADRGFAEFPAAIRGPVVPGHERRRHRGRRSPLSRRMPQREESRRGHRHLPVHADDRHRDRLGGRMGLYAWRRGRDQGGGGRCDARFWPPRMRRGAGCSCP